MHSSSSHSCCMPCPWIAVFVTKINLQYFSFTIKHCLNPWGWDGQGM
jgi:hypothetical protein